MTPGVRWYLVGSFVLVTLAGCTPSWMEEREPGRRGGEMGEPWGREAEMACLKTGTVKESPSVALLGPINGPGMCGADFPLKVAALGESQTALGYWDDSVRPPGMVPAPRPALSAAAAPTGTDLSGAAAISAGHALRGQPGLPG